MAVRTATCPIFAGPRAASCEALAEYCKTCDLSPDDPIAFADFVLALLQDGKPEKAIVNYRKSAAIRRRAPRGARWMATHGIRPCCDAPLVSAPESLSWWT